VQGLRGLLYAPIVVAELLRDLSEVEAGQVRVELFDSASGTASGPLMFDSGVLSPAPAAARFDMLVPVGVPGRLLTARLRSTPVFDAAFQSLGAWLAGLGGLPASGLLAALLRQQVTGRSRAEALAAQMTADLGRLALVARSTSNAVVITDAQRRITWVNAGFERLTGYCLDEALGQSPGALLQTEDTDPATLKAMRDALVAGQGFRGDILNRAKGGRQYWLALDIQPLHDEDGVLNGFMAIETDITDRLNAERALQRERHSLQNIVEATQVGTWEWNVQTGATVFNERWATMLGYSLAELGPTSIETRNALVQPEDLARSAGLIEMHCAGATAAYSCEIRMRHKRGHWAWVQDRGKLFGRNDDGQPRWMAGTHADITERKQAEAALRASQAFLSQTGRIGGVGGWALNLATQTMAWTEQACIIHDLPPGHQPTLAEGLGYCTAEARPTLQAALQRCIQGGAGFDMELPFVTARGRPVWVRVIGHVEMVDGKPARLAGALQDVSTRRAMEAELRAKNDLVSTVIDNLPCGLSVFDGDLKLVAANHEFRRLLALPDTLFDAPTVRFEDIIRFNAARGEYGSDDVEASVQAIIQRALHGRLRGLPPAQGRSRHARHHRRLRDGP
jgi:PAS domain S-box-containing protein